MIETHPWDPTEGLDTEEDMIDYLEAALELDDPWLVAAALTDIARAKGMPEVAQEVGLSDESMYESNRRGDGLDFAIVLKLTRALGLRLHAGGYARIAGDQGAREPRAADCSGSSDEVALDSNSVAEYAQAR